MDPEGLKMNDKIYVRYGEMIKPIAYSKQSINQIYRNRLK